MAEVHATEKRKLLKDFEAEKRRMLREHNAEVEEKEKQFLRLDRLPKMPSER